MNEFILYSLQTAAIQLLFLIVYVLFLKNETFFKWNRLFLLASLILSFLIPVLQFPNVFSSNIAVIQNTNNLFIKLKPIEAIAKTQNTGETLYSLLIFVYLLGFSFLILLFFKKLYKIWILKTSSKKTTINNIDVFIIKNSDHAFTFLNMIFIGEKNLNNTTIVAHENIHKTKYHSLDLLILEATKIIFWFNPIIIVYQKWLTEVHEFEADYFVSQKNKKEYYKTILNQVFSSSGFAFTNTFFNKSLIKKRIIMMQKTKSQKTMLLKYAAFIPAIVLSALLFSNCSQNNTIEESGLLDKGIEETKPIDKDVPFTVVDQVPQFKNCENTTSNQQIECFNTELQKHVKKHFNYPSEAAKQNIQGRVSVYFKIDKKGNVNEIKTRGPKNGELLEEECKRIINLLPPFIPATYKGEYVNVKYGLPINFKLQ